MTVRIERRWTLVAFKHPDLEHSVYYRKGIVHIDRAVTFFMQTRHQHLSLSGLPPSIYTFKDNKNSFF